MNLRNKITYVALYINFFTFGWNPYSFSEEIKSQKPYVNKYSELRENIDYLIDNDKEIKKAFIGIKIRDLNKKKDLYYLNAEKLFVPASNMKIFTTLFSLEKLGKNFSYKTTVTTDGKVNNGVLDGNIYLNLSGDPTLKNINLINLLESIKNKNIKKITGDFLVNFGDFENIPYGKGWMYDDFNDCYSSPTGVLTIDDNCINFEVKAVDNSNITVKSDNKISFDTSEIGIVRKEIKDISIQNYSEKEVKLTGRIGLAQSQKLEQSILNPQNYFNNIISDYLRKNVEFTGQIKYGKFLDSGTTELGVNTSIPLSEILKKFNKESHNLTGELLLKTAFYKEKYKEEEIKSPSDLMKKYFEESFYTSFFNFVDGSGLSRYNMLSPSLMLDVLEYSYEKADYKKIIFSAFPLGGKEGTLQNRLKNIPENYKIIAKSGSMTGVNCLSGFITNSDETKNISFSIMINNSNLSGKQLRTFQDKVLLTVIEQYM